jgi:hypothetical protein
MSQSAERQMKRGVGLTPLSGAALLIAMLLALAAGAIWLWLTASLVLAGAPRLSTDRTEIDLGYQKYATRVRAEFVLTNTGEGTLTLDVPARARALKGC